ncbi:MAG: nicotinate-nucleotide adenylyltransferase NadD [Idiomarinaceae bacterium HL-53]|nr:MAG: nicotinate-nucleotide adenylyltransferase NadD [Idiomarinaceae bacterium HL-53]CUS48758.1 nicotinate-nucleotide adenylyltransferase [Idiomarinaceae bacterium HL-53]
MTKRIAIVGGTFDPVHKGHLEPVLAIAPTFDWQQIRLMPTYTPPYREQPLATDQQRLDMLNLVCAEKDLCIADDFELKRAQPSRTVPTLQAFKAAHPESELYFIMGMDSFVQLNQWQDWQKLTQFAHLVILPRPEYSLAQLPNEVREWMRLNDQPHQVFETQAPVVPISSTEIRAALANPQQRDWGCKFLYPQVVDYIESHNLYGSLPNLGNS